MINFGLVGLGQWGPILARNLNNTENAVLSWACDVDDRALGKLGPICPASRVTRDIAEMLSAPDIDAVVVATPANTHFEITRHCLEAGKHVLVEKPFVMSTSECDELIDMAGSKGLTLMVGHTSLYSPPVLKLKELSDAGDIGDVYYSYSTRANLGPIRGDVNVMWNLAPHDIAIFLYLFGDEPVSVSARGITHIQPGIEDVAFLDLSFAGNISAHIHVSWLDPGKIRKLTLVGSKKMVVYDDANPDAKIQIFDKGVTKVANGSGESFASFGEFQLMLRAGDVLIPKIAATEPLRIECQHFADCILSNERPLTDGVHGRNVIRVLEAAQRSMNTGSAPVAIEP